LIDGPGGLDTGELVETPFELTGELRELRARAVAASRQRELHREDTARLETEIGLLELLERAVAERRAHRENECQRELRHDECVAPPLSGESVRAKRGVELSLPDEKNRREPKKNAAEQARAEGDAEHERIRGDCFGTGKASRCECYERFERECAERYASESAQGREGKALRQ